MAATGMNPSISIGVAPDHPPTIPTYGDKFEYRTYGAIFTEAVAGEGVQFRANGFTAPGSFYVDKIQVWKASTGGGLGLNAGFYQQNSTDLGLDTVNGVDLGTATSLPGVTFKVPEGHAVRVSNATTSILADAKCVTEGPNVGTSAKPNTFAAHLHCWVQL